MQTHVTNAKHSSHNGETPALNAEPVNILIIDDLPEKLLVYETILEGLGQNLVKARSGQEALKLVLQQEFAVILLDVNMPGMDGFETASLIRQRKKSSHTPIIFLTAFTDEMRMAQGYASGAVDYLPTPVVPEVLRAKVRVFIELHQMRRQAALQAEERALRTAAEASNRRSQFLLAASESIAHSESQNEVLSIMTRLPLPDLADVAMVCLTKTEGWKEHIHWAYTGPDKEICVGPAAFSAASLATLEKIVQPACASDQSHYFAYVTLSDLLPMEKNEAASCPYDASGQASILTIPISIRNQCCGALILARAGGRAFERADISLAKELVARAATALEKAQLVDKIKEADQRKNEFLATLAHELRNPLAPIRNALQIMRASPNRSIREEAQNVIERQVEHMVHLVNDLMDVSRITQGKIELRKERIMLKDILAHTTAVTNALLKQRNHRLIIKAPEEAIWIDADPTRISQIFSNLLNNAAKYTPDNGRIEIAIEREEEWVSILISDTGIGIPKDMLSRIFDIFLQVDSSLERAEGGLGIGLTLVKSLVKMHGGTIEARSEGIGKGSTFIIRLPLAQQPPALSVQGEWAPDSPVVPLRVLVVDDNESSAKVLGWMVEIIGHTVQRAHTGASALELARTYKPEVVLLDIGLPGMNGYEVCQAMREESILKNTVFIAQTGWGQPEHRQRSKEAGFDHHLVKPVNMQDLQEILAGLQTGQLPPRPDEQISPTAA